MNVGSNYGQDYLRAVRGITASSFPTEEDRMKALLATYEVLSKLETPWDTYVRIHLNQVRPKRYANEISIYHEVLTKS